MSHTFDAPQKKEHQLPKKIKVEQARKQDVVLPPRTQLHISPEELITDVLHGLQRFEHDETTCLHCASELDPDYYIDENGFCHITEEK